jgi:two-component system, response regulator
MKTRVILLVEDDADDETFTRMALQDSNILNELVVVRDGEEALHYLFGTGPYAERNGKDLPAVVLLDLRLPKLDGLAVLRAIRSDERTKFLPVVVFTSSGGEQALIESYHLGANSYVEKPLNFAQFAEAVRILGMYWVLLNDPPSSAASKKPGRSA